MLYNDNRVQEGNQELKDLVGSQVNRYELALLASKLFFTVSWNEFIFQAKSVIDMFPSRSKAFKIIIEVKSEQIWWYLSPSRNI